MKSYLLTTGLNALTAQDLNPASQLLLTGFTAGDAYGFTPTPLNQTIPGSTVFTGTDTNMEYIPISSDEVIIKCFVPRTVGPVAIGNIVLFAENSPFCVSVAHESWIKEVTTTTQTGSLYCFQQTINIPQIFDRFSFANLNMNRVNMLEVDSENEMVTYPWEEAHEQFVIKNHSKLNKPIMVANAWNDYWATPFMTQVDSIKFGVLDGGE